LLTLVVGGAKFGCGVAIRVKRTAAEVDCREETIECACAKTQGRNECTRVITAVEQKNRGSDRGLFVGDRTYTNLSLSKLCGEMETERESERVVVVATGVFGLDLGLGEGFEGAGEEFHRCSTV